MDLRTSAAYALLCLVLAGCNPPRWKEISPAKSLVELREQYRLPVPETKDETITYRAAIQSFRGGEFVAIRMDAPREALDRLEAATSPDPSWRSPSERGSYLKGIGESIKWWPREDFISRTYLMKPPDLDTYLLTVIVADTQQSPFALFILTPRAMFHELHPSHGR